MNAKPKDGSGIARLTGIQTVVEWLLLFVTLFTTPFIIRRLGTNAYGALGVVSVLSSQLGFFQLGVGSATTRMVAGVRGKGTPDDYQVILRTALTMGGLGSLLVGVGVAVLAPRFWGASLTDVVATGAGPGLIVATVLIAGAQPIFNALGGVLAGDMRFDTWSLIRLVHGVAKLLLMLGIAYLSPSLPLVLWGIATADVVAVLAVYRFIPIDRAHSFPWRHLLASARTMMAIGIPFAIASTLQALLFDAEKLVIASSGGLTDFTHYSVPYNAVMKTTILPVALLGPLMADFARAHAASLHGELVQLARRASKIILAVMAVSVIPLIAILPDFLRLWLGSEFADVATGPMRVICVGILLYTNVYVSHAAIRAVGRPTIIPFLYGAELVVYSLALYLLFPRWGLMGAASAWFIRAVVDAAAHLVIANHVLSERIDLGLWSWWPGGLAGAVALLFMGVPQLGIVARILLSCVAAFLAAWPLLVRADLEFLIGVVRRRLGARAKVELR